MYSKTFKYQSTYDFGSTVSVPIHIINYILGIAYEVVNNLKKIIYKLFGFVRTHAPAMMAHART